MLNSNEIEELRNSGDFASIDWHFASMLIRHCAEMQATTQEARGMLELVTASVLACVRRSHSCLALSQWCEQKQRALPNFPTADELRALFEQFPSVIGFDDEAKTPLILCDDLLYLSRYRQYEARIAEHISAYAMFAPNAVKPTKAQLTQLRAACRHFANADYKNNRQMQAVLQALASPFFVLTGGPGTGKTTVMTVILALQLSAHPDWRVMLAAPTGKAAARMKEAITNELNNSLTGLDDTTRAALADLTARTLNRMLEINPETGLARYNRDLPLSADLVIVDECSMTSLKLFAQLLDALPENAHLILIGDKNQLASVESGVVFGEICEFLPTCAPTQLCTLVENHRSKNNANLCNFARALVTPDEVPDYALLINGAEQENGVFKRIPLSKGGLEDAIAHVMHECGIAFSANKKFHSPEEAFELSDKFKILCAVRAGKYGVINLNLTMCDLLKIKQEDYPDGMPVMILENDPDTALNNGDVGVCFDGKVYFRGENNIMRKFTPVQLPVHECAFAMTIHKSQGSDYPNVLMVLPDHDGPILSRELLYTGITRAKTRFFLIAEPGEQSSPEKVLECAAQRKTERWSGLAYLLAMSVCCAKAEAWLIAK